MKTDLLTEYIVFKDEVDRISKIFEGPWDHATPWDPPNFPTPWDNLPGGGGEMTPGGRLATAALVAAAVVAAIKLYKQYLSKAAKACQGAPDKTACMNKYKKDAQKTKVQQLQKYLPSCKHAKKPEKCKAQLQARINKEKAKLSRMG